jgi:hypothetical protein
VGEDTAGDWLVYATGSDVSAIVPDGNVIWAASDGGLLRWDRETGDLTQYAAPYVPLPSNNLIEMLLHDGRLYIGVYGGIVVFDRQDEWTVFTEQDIGIEIEYYSPLAVVENVLWVGGEGRIAQLYPDGHWETIRVKRPKFPSPEVRRIVYQPDGVQIEVTQWRNYEQESAVLRSVNGRWKKVEHPLPDYLAAPDGSLWKWEDCALLRSTDKGASWHEILTGSPFAQPRAVDQNGLVYVSRDDAVLVFAGDHLIEAYRFTDLGPELGYINIIEWDDRGRMWVATDGRGLTMYDGHGWHNWRTGNSDLREDSIRGLAVSEGKVYAGVRSSRDGGGLSIYDAEQDQWTHYWPDESELSGGGVGGIAIDAQGRAYLPTAAGVIDIFDHGRWEHLVVPAAAGKSLDATDGLFEAEGTYWLATERLGLLGYDETMWHTVSMPGGGGVYALAQDQAGRLWATVAYGLLVRDLDGNWHYYTARYFPVTGGWMADVAVDPKGRIWIAGASSLTVFNGEKWQTFPSDLVGGGWGGAIDFDKDGRPWIALSYGGVAVFRGHVDIDPFTELTPPTQMKEFTQPRPLAWQSGVFRALSYLLAAVIGISILATLAVGAGLVLLLVRRASARKGSQ